MVRWKVDYFDVKKSKGKARTFCLSTNDDDDCVLVIHIVEW